MGGRERDQRDACALATAAAGGDADRGMRVDQHAGRAQHLGYRCRGLVLLDPRGIEQLAGAPERIGAHAQALVHLKLRHQPGHEGALPAAEIEQQALEIARDLDVHARARGRHDRAGPIDAGLEEARQDVVAVGRDDQLGERQAHPMREVAGVDVAEIAGRHGEGDPPQRGAQRQRRAHVVDRLGHDPAPVDRVDGGEVELLAQPGVAEQRLQQRLAVIERALDREVVDVRRGDRGHLPALDLGDPAVRMEDHDADPLAPGKGLDRGRAGVARGRPDDHDRRPAAAQEELEQPAEQLHRDVFEGERGPVEQLEQPVVGPELAQRRDRGMIEPGIGRLDQRAKLGPAQRVPDERRQEPRSNLLIGSALQLLELVALDARPDLRHIQPAIGRQPGKQRRLEATGRHVTAGADVAQGHLYPIRRSRSG